MARQLLVEGDTTFRITLEETDKITFGPWSPPNDKGAYHSNGGARGTLRVYRGSKDNCIAVFTGVTTFREDSVKYSELVAKEEGAKIWKSDMNGYEREEKVTRTQEWIDPVPAIEAPKKPKKAKKK